MKKKSLKRNIIEWALLIGIPVVIYLAGWHTEVLGTIQRLVLKTGVIQPDFIEESERQQAEYSMPLKSFGGEFVSLEQYRGKTIFLNFWASWCPPCVAEMPSIQSLYEMSDTSQIKVILINIDDDIKKAEDFLNRKEFTMPNYRLAGAFPSVYQSSTIPTTFIISPSGKIAAKITGMADYESDSFIDKLKNLK